MDVRKMNDEQALEFFNSFYTKDEELSLAITNAKIALKYRIPKQVEILKPFSFCEKRFLCPTCGRRFTEELVKENLGYEYHCEECGQNIDFYCVEV